MIYFLILIFLISRFTNLTLLPIFSDEANYLEWGWRAIHTGQWFHALDIQDGKQPLLMWLFGLGQTIFSDPLFGARTISVFTGLLNMLGLYYLGSRVFNKNVGLLSSILYTLSPIFFFFDRQALMESSLVTTSISSLIYLIHTTSKPGIKHALILGIILGIGFFIKSTTLIFIITTLSVLILKTIKTHSPHFLTLSIFLLLSFILTVSPLLLYPNFWTSLAKNSGYALTPVELIRFPIATWAKTFPANFQVIFLFFTPLVLIAALLDLRKLPKLIIFWIVFPLVIYLISVRNANALLFRYSVPFLPILLIPAANFFSRHKTLLTVSIILNTLYLILLILSPPTYFNFFSKITPYSYASDYLTGYDTGYQVNAIRTYLASQTKPFYVTTKVASFNPESGLITYLHKDPLVTTAYLDQRLFGDSLTQYDCLSTNQPLYFIAKQNDTAGLEKFLIKKTVITNSYNPDFSTVYILKSDCPPEKTAHLNLILP